ncbi:caspase family protein [Moorena sp. SIO3B2]|uniref:caspase family protein n=1 Tax=Moorena sp. SIO3B2 TaxID=2607827 RepID=UPI00338EEA92
MQLLKVKDEQASREAVINRVRNHLRQAGKNDVVLFYYSGHGSQELAPKEFWDIEPYNISYFINEPTEFD